VLTAVTSADDPRVADYKQTADPAALSRSGIFVAEGRWVVQRLLTSRRFATRSVLVTPVAGKALVAAVGEALDSVPTYVVDQPVMDRLVGYNIHRGCLALGDRPAVDVLAAATLRDVQRVVVLEGVNNPDNVGGIFRSAAAFGVDLIALGPGCGDPLYRKAVRTSMAATLEVPYVDARDWPGALDLIRAARLQIAALTPKLEAIPLERAPRFGRVAILLGGEGTGLTSDALARADVTLRIRTTTRVDSLNVTVAGSIAMHHLFAAT
jgi:tRNA G18 (ribose-2'-O)-methylase SpoU